MADARYRTAERLIPERGALARRQAALLRLSTAIAAARDEEEVYRSVVTGLHDEALGYNFLGVFLVDESTGERVLQASAGWSGVPDDWRVPPGQGLSARTVPRETAAETPARSSSTW